MGTQLLSRTVGHLPRWFAPVAVGIGVVVATVALGVIDPEARAHILPGCPFRRLTGLDCPGCGGTRAVYALTQGELLQALDHNVLTVLLLPVLLVAWVAWLRFRLGRRPTPLTLPPAASYSIAVAFLVFWVVRNLPWFPFTWLGSGIG